MDRPSSRKTVGQSGDGRWQTPVGGGRWRWAVAVGGWVREWGSGRRAGAEGRGGAGTEGRRAEAGAGCGRGAGRCVVVERVFGALGACGVSGPWRRCPGVRCEGSDLPRQHPRRAVRRLRPAVRTLPACGAGGRGGSAAQVGRHPRPGHPGPGRVSRAIRLRRRSGRTRPRHVWGPPCARRPVPVRASPPLSARTCALRSS